MSGETRSKMLNVKFSGGNVRGGEHCLRDKNLASVSQFVAGIWRGIERSRRGKGNGCVPSQFAQRYIDAECLKLCDTVGRLHYLRGPASATDPGVDHPRIPVFLDRNHQDDAVCAENRVDRTRICRGGWCHKSAVGMEGRGWGPDEPAVVREPDED
jgi:hypothetical protein